MISELAQKEAAAVRAFDNTFILGCRRTPKGLEVWSTVGSMQYQLGIIGANGDELTYRPSAPDIYNPPEYLPKFAMDVAKRAGLRIG